ncbi:MAG: DUF2290 domain-containing protein [Rhodospirillaceae bacterium]|jgi:hypothetical protein|nr:DUF2290 domain-containing protein [Rhodospirillaceae bacterium]
MNQSDVANGIRRSWNHLESADLANDFAASHPLRVDEEYRKVILKQDVSYEEIYLTAANRKHYNFMSVDFSMFLFSCSNNNDVAYAFLPSPYNSSDADVIKEHRKLLDADMINQEEFDRLLSDASVHIMQPPIRYEHASDQYDEFSHPCSHFHIGFDRDNRWAVDRELTPAAFTLLIMQKYFFSAWERFDNDDSEFKNILNEALVNEKAGSPIVPLDLLSTQERRLFYFS